MPTKTRPHYNHPRPLTIGTKVIIRVGFNHRQFNRLLDSVKFRWIKGTVDWVCPSDPRKMELRINRNDNIVWQRGENKEGKEDFYIRVEWDAVDCYNFRDVIVIRRV